MSTGLVIKLGGPMGAPSARHGSRHVEGRVLHAGDFHHAEAHSDHGESYTVSGCQLLIVATTTDYEG